MDHATIAQWYVFLNEEGPQPVWVIHGQLDSCLWGTWPIMGVDRSQRRVVIAFTSLSRKIIDLDLLEIDYSVQTKERALSQLEQAYLTFAVNQI